MRFARDLVPALIAGGILGAAPAHALTEADLRNCDSLQAERSIPGCSAVIDEPRVPDNMKGLARLKRGMAYFSVKKIDAAIADLEVARKLRPDDHVAANELGLAYAEKGDEAKAIAAYDDGIRANPKSGDLYNNRAAARFRLKEFDKAIADIREAIRLGPSGRTAVLEREREYDRSADVQVFAARYQGLAAVYEEMGEYGKAIAAHDESIARFPRAGAMYLNRAKTYLAKGDIKLAVADLDRAMALDGETPQGLGRKAFLRFQIGELAAAATDLRRAWALDPDKTTIPKAYVPIWVHLMLARSDATAARQALIEMMAKVDQGKWPGPVAKLMLGELTPEGLLKAAGSKDESCEAHFYIGQYHLQRGNRAPAIAALKTAAETCPPTFFEATGAKAELARNGK
jgi:tetratricopeptide (TPR) repeat protein